MKQIIFGVCVIVVLSTFSCGTHGLPQIQSALNDSSEIKNVLVTNYTKVDAVPLAIDAKQDDVNVSDNTTSEKPTDSTTSEKPTSPDDKTTTTSTLAPDTTSSTTTAPETTTPSTTTKAPETTTPSTTTQAPDTTTASTSTKGPDTTTTDKPTPSPTTTPTPAPRKPCRSFDLPSFIGGIILTIGLLAISIVAYKFYKARTAGNYHTL